jgi:hypothetical protein
MTVAGEPPKRLRPTALPHRTPPARQRHLHQRTVRIGPRTGPGSPYRHDHRAAAGAYHHHHEVAVAAVGYQLRLRATTPPYPDQARKGPDLGLLDHAAPALVANCRRTQLQHAATTARILAVAQPISAEPPDRDRPVGPS